MENENIYRKNQESTFVRDLIQIASSFGHDKELFHKKVFEIINIDSLRERGIIQIEEALLDESSRAVLQNNRLSDREFALCCLKQQGFSADEIKVMFGLKNIRSIYVKFSRLKKKMKDLLLKTGSLDGAALPEAILVMLILCIIILLVGSLCDLF